MICQKDHTGLYNIRIGKKGVSATNVLDGISLDCIN